MSKKEKHGGLKIERRENAASVFERLLYERMLKKTGSS